MRRRYQRELYAERVGLIKAIMPHCCIGVDVIVDFRERPMPTSGRPSTSCINWTYPTCTCSPILSGRIPGRRNERGGADEHTPRTQQTTPQPELPKMQYFTSQHIGQTRKVLFESKNRNGMLEGYTDNYIKITVPYQQAWENSITEWKI